MWRRIVIVAAVAALAGVLDDDARAQDLPVLERGDRGVAVTYWQGVLNQWLDYAREGQRILGEDGVFGPRTEAATRDFQSAAGISVDGIVGESTWTALYRVLADRAQRLISRVNVVPEWPVPISQWSGRGRAGTSAAGSSATGYAIARFDLRPRRIGVRTGRGGG